MARAISVRLDEEALSALTLLEAAGVSRSQALRRALVEAAARLRDKKALAAEVAALEADDADRSEMLTVADLMERLRAPGRRLRYPASEGDRTRTTGRQVRRSCSGGRVPPQVRRADRPDLAERPARVVPARGRDRRGVHPRARRTGRCGGRREARRTRRPRHP